MAEDKNSFLLYADQKHLFDQLPDEIAGQLIKLIYSYVNDENPEPNDLVLRIAFEPIKRQLKRDLQEWQQKKQKRSEAGKLGGAASAEAKSSKTKQNQAIVEIVNDSQANQAVNVNDNVNGNVTVNVNDTVNNLNKKSSEKKIEQFPTMAFVQAMELNEMEVERVGVYVKQKLTPAALDDYWQSFSAKFDGSKFYQDRGQIISYFMNWLKGELSKKKPKAGKPERTWDDLYREINEKEARA